ncbi:MAG: DUF6236 family protein [Nitrososphaera sp.]|nr:DUF6236 family protein [Nitrososphaera sp.]
MSSHQQVSNLKRTILYYPTISIPTSDWLRRSILYWDEIGSIVPIDYEEKTLTPYSSDIQFLKAEGEFRPFRPRGLVYEKAQELMKELISIIETPKFQNILPPREMRLLHSRMRIHIEKISDAIVDYLVHWGLAQRDKEDRDWIRCENHTALLYMAILAKYLADEDSMATVPGTDLQEYENLIFGVMLPSNGFACLTTNYMNMVPVPREDVPLSDIVEFKRKRWSELLEFRQQINEFHRSLKACQSKSDANDIAATFSEKITKELDNLKAVMDDSRLATIVGSLKTIIKLDSPALWATAGVMVGQATQVANVPIQWSVAGIGILGAIEIANFICDKRNERRATLRDSPFAYLYHAQREGILK